MQDNWDKLLLMAEFAINDSVSLTTGFSPFQLMYGMHPRKPIDMIAESRTPAAADFIKEMMTTISRAQENILKAQTGMKAQADKHRRDHQIKIGDKVMLKTKNLKLKSMHSHKLAPKWIGPFTVIGSRHKDSFELDLEGKYRIHPVFHVNLLKPWIPNDQTQFPNRVQDPPSPVIVDDQEEFEVDSIINKRTRFGKTQYLVTWKGYRPEDSTWEPLKNLQNAMELIKEFDSRTTSTKVQTVDVKLHVSGRNFLKKGDGNRGKKSKSTENSSSKQKMKITQQIINQEVTEHRAAILQEK